MTKNVQEVPQEVGSPYEARQLIGSARKLRVEYQDMKARSLQRLQEAIDKVKWIDDKISEVDIHIGRLYHAIDKSGISAPLPIVPRKNQPVVIKESKDF
jgi:hypothetical protein